MMHCAHSSPGIEAVAGALVGRIAPRIAVFFLCFRFRLAIFERRRHAGSVVADVVGAQLLANGVVRHRLGEAETRPQVGRKTTLTDRLLRNG